MIISYIMPTYNSEQTIEKSLKSIIKQNINKNDYEILVIDGGSTDNTIAIAQKYGATIIDNPERLPEPAKKIGMLHAKGKFVCKIDSDEELIYDNQIMERIRIMDENNVYVSMPDKLICSKSNSVSAEYINCYGDPFTRFVYQMKIGNRATFSSHLIKEPIYDSKGCSKSPIGDGGTVIINWEYVKYQFKNQINNQKFINSLTARILEKEGKWICIKGDNIIHHNQLTLYNQLRKIKFRVINNIHSPEESGFSSRNVKNKVLNRRKYLFLIYACTLIGPVLESIFLVIKHSNYKFFIHLFLVYYTIYEIAIQYIYKILGISKYNQNYAK